MSRKCIGKVMAEGTWQATGAQDVLRSCTAPAAMPE